MLHGILSNFAGRETAAGLLLLAALFLAWHRPLFADSLFREIERWGARLSKRKSMCLALIAAVVILLRLALLPWLPVPAPQIHDEFSYLLAGDTFAHGRLANPTHPMWVYFDTIHVNQIPTYISKYPPAQGAALALGQLLGNPWLGVLLSTAAMCAAILWMLQGWLPPGWALLGGTLVALRLAVFAYWMNSYWGGAVPALGGALAVGALPRILRQHRKRDAVILAFGSTILANSRPVEGLALLLPVMAVLALWLYRQSGLQQIVLPFSIVALVCGVFMGYYNWRGTGHAFLFPYVLNERMFSSTPIFIWQQAGPPRHYINAQFEWFYNSWNRGYWNYYRVNSLTTAVRHVGLVVPSFVRFFLWPELCVPLIALPWLSSSRKTRFLVVQIGLCFLISYSILWFLPHYAAPATASVFALVTQGLRHLRRWKYRGQSVGVGLSRMVVLSALLFAPFHQHTATLFPPPPDIKQRAEIASRLNALPGMHLVIVRYSPAKESGEWVYNAADINHAKIVWAREIPGMSIVPLLRYFKDRKVWLVEPAENPRELKPYSPQTALNDGQ